MKNNIYKKCKIIILLVLSISFSCHAQNSRFLVDSIQLINLEYVWLGAEFTLDTATISQLMDEGFVGISSSGISTKNEELKSMYLNISERQKNGHKIDSFYFDNILIKLFDSTAIVTFETVTKGRKKDIPFTNRRMRFYDVWILRNGTWKAISSQGTLISSSQ